MSTKVAINGLGRIGRAILKLVMDEPTIELVAVNDLVDAENLASLRFHASLGFEASAALRQVGRKFDRWLDLVFVQRML